MGLKGDVAVANCGHGNENPVDPSQYVDWEILVLSFRQQDLLPPHYNDEQRGMNRKNDR